MFIVSDCFSLNSALWNGFILLDVGRASGLGTRVVGGVVWHRPGRADEARAVIVLFHRARDPDPDDMTGMTDRLDDLSFNIMNHNCVHGMN